MKEQLKQEFPQFEKNYDQLDKLARLVEQKSKEINITAIRDYENIWKKHILDSLMCSNIPSVESKLSDAKVLDLGTGGGFPGLPLAITHSEAQFTLLDSTRKKLDVVNEFAHFAGAKNVQTKWGRSNELEKEIGSSFDIVTSRAVALLPQLITLCAPFINKTGVIVLYKQNVSEEIKEGDTEAKKFGLILKEKYEYTLEPEINYNKKDRVILVYAKA